ncbi:ecotin family protein, partial [Paraburkholderia sp. SIMBA_027]|uniref:ecotin family protein n=1 Tax=Paraburkholderia sp. SIMBA_027 TaxID=3085770 RepID=UPI00397894A9
GPASAPAVPAESIKMFPQPAAGQQRAVIALPALENEGDARVELMIGKTLWNEFNSNRDWPVSSAVATILLLILVVPIVFFQN